MITDPAYLRAARSSPVRLLQAALIAVSAALAVAPAVSAAESSASANAGTVTGVVTNKTTGNGLEGAKVDLPAVNMTTLVDHSGRYTLHGVPPGTYEVVVSYTSLDTQRAQVSVNAGQRATHDFEMTSAVYMLDAFKVSSEREGTAAAITERKNASNLKEVVAMDTYGNLPNLNATELAIRLPGVTFADPGDEVVEQIQVRGMGPASSTITIDGGLMSSFSAEGRTTRATAFTGAMFESLEIIKGHTPDMSADSLGGTVNFKTRSPLSMKEKRRITYNLSTTYRPTFAEQDPLIDKHRTHPLFNFGYIEKYRIFGSGEDNLAVSINAFYSENDFGFFQTTRDYQQGVYPGFMWDYRTQDDYNLRVQKSLNTKFEFRLSPNSLFKVNAIINDAPEPMRRQYLVRAFTGSQTTALSNTSGIVPGAYNSRITVVRPTTGSDIDVTSTLINRNQKLRQVDLGGEHNWGPFNFDWAADYSLTRYRTLGEEGALNMRIVNTGWIIDRTKSDLYPQFKPNGGLDFTNPNNYHPRPTDGLSSNAGDLSQHRVRQLRGNVKYLLPIESFTAYLKTGVDLREQTSSLWNNRRRWVSSATAVLPTDPSIITMDQLKTHRNIPMWEGAAYIQNGEPVDPALWTEDKYFYESTKFTGNHRIQESVASEYVQAQVKFGTNGLLGGVRREETDTEAKAYVKVARGASTAAQQVANPVAAAAQDYGAGWRVIDGTYANYFPSAHFYRNFTPNLKGRVSWSTSFTRPSMTNALPTETVNDTTKVVTQGNPALLPSKAKNWDVDAEYYFPPAGTLSVSWFHKDVKDYIIAAQNVGTIGSGTDNGYNGQYQGYELQSSTNAGGAIFQGWEFSYVQQFRFLPGLLKTISFNGNYTVQKAHGDFGVAGAYRTGHDVARYIPRTGNVSLSWSYKRFDTRILYSHTAGYLFTYNAIPSREDFMRARDTVNVGAGWRLNSQMTLQLDIANIFNQPQIHYLGIPDQMQRFLMQGTKVQLGVRGQF